MGSPVDGKKRIYSRRDQAGGYGTANLITVFCVSLVIIRNANVLGVLEILDLV